MMTNSMISGPLPDSSHHTCLYLGCLCYSLFCRYVWESKADGAFAISEDTWNEPLGRGTEIRLHLREEAGEYLEESKLKVCILLYNCFICCEYLLMREDLY